MWFEQKDDIFTVQIFSDIFKIWFSFDDCSENWTSGSHVKLSICIKFFCFAYKYDQV